MRLAVHLFPLILGFLGCASPSFVPDAVPEERRIPARDRRLVWETVLRKRRHQVAPDSFLAVTPQVLLLRTTPDSAEGRWLGSLFADHQLVDGFCSRRSPCECQSKALVPMEYLTLNEPRLWRADTVEALLDVAGTYPAWATGVRGQKPSDWMIGWTSIHFYLVKHDSSWTVIPTPSDPDRLLALVGDGVCEY